MLVLTAVCCFAETSTTIETKSSDAATASPGAPPPPQDSSVDGKSQLEVRDVWERVASRGARRGGYVLSAPGGGDVARVRYTLGPNGGAVRVAVRRVGASPESLSSRGRSAGNINHRSSPPAAIFLPPYYGMDSSDYGYDFDYDYDYDYDFDSYAPSFFYDDYDPDMDPDFFRRRRRSVPKLTKKIRA